jgi:hypothetical protein
MIFHASEVDKALHAAAQRGDFRRVRELAYQYLKSIPPDPNRNKYSLEAALSGIRFTAGQNPEQREKELAAFGWVRCYGGMFLHPSYFVAYKNWVYDK